MGVSDEPGGPALLWMVLCGPLSVLPSEGDRKAESIARGQGRRAVLLRPVLLFTARPGPAGHLEIEMHQEAAWETAPPSSGAPGWTSERNQIKQRQDHCQRPQMGRPGRIGHQKRARGSMREPPGREEGAPHNRTPPHLKKNDFHKLQLIFWSQDRRHDAHVAVGESEAQRSGE